MVARHVLKINSYKINIFIGLLLLKNISIVALWSTLPLAGELCDIWPEWICALCSVFWQDQDEDE